MLNRWTGALAWAVVMVIVWTIFVPRVLSSTVFVWINAMGVTGLAFAYALWAGTRQTASVTRLLHDIEAQPRAAGSSPVDVTFRG
jgi:hypothetical protein